MNGKCLYDWCNEMKWDKLREFLDSDSNKDKKLQVVRYRGWGDWKCLHKACRNGAPGKIMKSLLGIGRKELLMITTKLIEY